GHGKTKMYVQQAKEQISSFRWSSPSKPTLPEDPPPPYSPSTENLSDMSYNANGPYSPNNNSSYNYPSAPKASNSSMNSPSNGHIYPKIPCATPDYSTNMSAIPTLPSSVPSNAQSPIVPTFPHAMSAPMLHHDSFNDRRNSVKYPSLHMGDRTSYNDTAYRHGVTASSPDIPDHCHHPPTSTPINSPPYNPHYGWTSQDRQEANESDNSDNHNHTGASYRTPNNSVSSNNPRRCSEEREPSVRPRTNLNPFLEDHAKRVR
ncbi:unnamed protein product, partial [Meganyctiphanes norvegica]